MGGPPLDRTLRTHHEEVDRCLALRPCRRRCRACGRSDARLPTAPRFDEDPRRSAGRACASPIAMGRTGCVRRLQPAHDDPAGKDAQPGCLDELDAAQASGQLRAFSGEDSGSAYLAAPAARRAVMQVSRARQQSTGMRGAAERSSPLNAVLRKARISAGLSCRQCRCAHAPHPPPERADQPDAWPGTASPAPATPGAGCAARCAGRRAARAG